MSLILLGILNSQVTGGAAGAYDLLETQVLSSSAASVTFTGLGSYSDYKHLQIRTVARSARSAQADGIYIRYNSDSGANYSGHLIEGNGTSVVADGAGSLSIVEIAIVDAASAGANEFGVAITDILDFNSTTKNKTTRSLTGTTQDYNSIRLLSNAWYNTNAITSIDLVGRNGNLVAGSRFSLYGVK